METARKLFPKRHLLKIKGDDLSKHEPVLLINAQSEQAIDANCSERTFSLVTREQAAEDWRTGVYWYLDPQQDGSWRIYNQGQAAHLLGGARGAVHLFGEAATKKDKGASWGLYEHKDSGTYALRPQEEAWLTLVDGELSLETFSAEIPKTSLWKIERPVGAKPMVERETAPPSLPGRVRRLLGRIKRKVM